MYTDEEGTKWNRIVTSPNASIDTQNDGTHEGFMKYTQNKKGTIGELWDASREASEKRSQEQGHDPVKEKHNNCCGLGGRRRWGWGGLWDLASHFPLKGY